MQAMHSFCAVQELVDGFLMEYETINTILSQTLLMNRRIFVDENCEAVTVF